MACYRPLLAYRLASGDVVFDRRRGAGGDQLELPCGQCIGCRLERSRQWAVRCVHESKMHEFNCFVTLTYSPEFLPPLGSLRYRDFQLFMKRLRKRFSDVPIRFYMCGEYGENLNRPHYHACLFGIDFADKRVFSRSASSVIYTSSVLSELWPFGFSTIGDVNFESAAYVARYVLKKITGDAADAHYSVVNVETGELDRLEPEFTRMSLKPGIGYPWFEKFRSDVFPHDRVIVRGKAMKPPRYYDRVYKKLLTLDWDEVEYSRYLSSLVRREDNTVERLAARELHTKLTLDNFKRGLV